MIDLRYRYLPDCLEVDGVEYPIHTDFRVWMAWVEELQAHDIADAGIFADEVPEGNWVPVAARFALNENSFPKGEGGTDRISDYVEDGEYLYAGFLQAYGVDLTDPDLVLHWHQFIALFRALPKDTMIAHIMGMRGYRKTTEKQDSAMKKAKRAWALPKRETAQDKQFIEWQKEAFGKIKPKG